jgi:hypothetical protein
MLLHIFISIKNVQLSSHQKPGSVSGADEYVLIINIDPYFLPCLFYPVYICFFQPIISIRIRIRGAISMRIHAESHKKLNFKHKNILTV